MRGFIFHRPLMVSTQNSLHPKGNQIHLHDVSILLIMVFKAVRRGVATHPLPDA